jgi:N-acetylmuramoyl-L-alanine amidase
LNFRQLSLFSAALSVAVVVALAQETLSQSAQPTAPGASPSLTLLSRDGRRLLPIVMVSDQEFVGLDDLAAAFQLAIREESGAITVSYKGKTIILTPEQTLASVAGRLISLPAPPNRSGRRWLVPVEFIARALAPIYDVRLELRKPAHLVIVGDLRVPRLTIKYEPVGAAARLTIDATPRATGMVSQDGDRLTVKFDADALDVPGQLLPPQPTQSIVQAVHVTDATTLTVDLGPRFAGFKAASQPVDPAMRLVIDFVAQPTETTPAQPPAALPAPAPSELPPAFAPPSTPIRTITIDPGHGGDDAGAKGANGTKEKDVALSVGHRVKGVIEARLGVRVLLTRDDDRSVPLNERTAIANNNKADLFISLHANASMRRSTTGASIICASFDTPSETAGAAHAGERLPTFGGGLRDIELVPWDLAQTRHLDQSVAFATILAESLKGRIPLGAHPVDRAPMRVLEPANMPAVLVEMGFLTNADQEKLLAGDAFQNTLVQAIYDSVVRFRDVLAAGGTR